MLQSEVIDLEDSSKVCKSWANHSTGIWTAAGALIKGGLLMCGGITGQNMYTKDCYFITPANSSKVNVRLSVESSELAAISLNETLLFTGGWSKFVRPRKGLLIQIAFLR